MNTHHKQKVFVTGATGSQGGQVARALLSAGHSVHAITRNTDSPAAQSLSQAGASIFSGDFSDTSSLSSAAKDCTAAFINVSPVFTDPTGEARHGQNVVAACLQAGVTRVVQSSVPSVERLERGELNGMDSPALKYRYSKIHVEHAVRDAGFESWTIVQVPRLLNSFVDPKLSRMLFPQLATDGIIRTVLPPEEPQSLLDPADIGRAVLQILEDESDRYRNKKVTLAGEKLSFQGIANVMNHVLGSERVKMEYILEPEARKLGKTNMIVASELLYFDNPGFLAVDENDFDFELNSAKGFFTRERAALGRAVGIV